VTSLPQPFFFVARERKTRRDWRRKEGGISDLLLLGGWRVFRRIPQQYPARPLASSSSPFAASGLYAPRAPRTAGAGGRPPLTPAASSWRKCRRARELARGTGERIPASSACLSATAVILIRTYRGKIREQEDTKVKGPRRRTTETRRRHFLLACGLPCASLGDHKKCGEQERRKREERKWGRDCERDRQPVCFTFLPDGPPASGFVEYFSF